MAPRMRRVILAVLVALGLAAGLQAAPASAAVQVDISAFHDRLAPYGHWFQHPRYGWTWHPTGVEIGWRPYTHGHWLWTAEYGWYWDSDYEWGWAPFHYGRWAFDDEYGWIWVPGPVWGPAWVVWRSGGGYAGWAPMPPEAVWQDGIGFGGVALDVPYAPAWTFCEERYLAAPRLTIVPPARNLAIIRQTTNVTNYVTINNRIVNKSVDVHRIEAVTHARITPVHIREVDRPLSTAKSHITNREVQVFRPTVELPQATSPTRKDLPRQGALMNRRQRMENEEPVRRPEFERSGNPQNPEILNHHREPERQALRHQEQLGHHWSHRWQPQCQGNPRPCEVK
jgi:hypothetical protein